MTRAPGGRVTSCPTTGRLCRQQRIQCETEGARGAGCPVAHTCDEILAHSLGVFREVRRRATNQCMAQTCEISRHIDYFRYAVLYSKIPAERRRAEMI